MSKSPKNAVIVKAPKITTAWTTVCATSAKSENEIVKSVENLSAVMVLESRLSVRDIKAVIKSSGKVSAFVSVSHVEALPTWSKLRALHADFKALPLAKQLSTASASYSLLGSGKGEQYPTLEALTKEIATVRKAKQSAPKSEAKEPKSKAPKDTLKDILAYFTALDTSILEDSQLDTIAEIHAVLDTKMANA